MKRKRIVIAGSGAVLLLLAAAALTQKGLRAQVFQCKGPIGCEKAIARHLQDGEEFTVSLVQLLHHGDKLFEAKWTVEEGQGRPLSKGTGKPISDSSSPLVFPRNFNRLSSPEANSCAGCHNEPGSGGGGDRVTEVFVLAQRFDFATFDHTDTITTRGAMDERGNFVTQDEHPVATSEDIANERKTLGMFGSGFIEMLARQMTADMQAIAAATAPGTSSALVTKGVSFGVITHNADGTWDTSQVVGLAAPSLSSTGTTAPSLIILPFHQAGAVVSIRQFTNNAFNHHHGIQAEERFGVGADPDGDGFINELTTADVTAVTIYQATLSVPGQVMSHDLRIHQAEIHGRKVFANIGCTTCHIAALPLDNNGWIYSEPNPYNPSGNLQPGGAPGYPYTVDLTSDQLPPPRLKPVNGVVMVPAFTDLKLHDITTGPTDPNAEALDQNQAAGSTGFFAGNTKFITKKLWGFANQGPFMHHGKFTTIREAILNHSGEALTQRQSFEALGDYDQGSVIEFLKTLQTLPPGSRGLVAFAAKDDDLE